jgi:isoleucyl-tRNA synthetase
MLVVIGNEADRGVITRMAELIREELNVKQIDVAADDRDLVDLTIKPNFRVLGKKAGSSMKALASEISALSLENIHQLEQKEMLSIMDFEIGYDDIFINREPKDGLQVITQDGVTVALETELTDELVAEGLAREFINRVQNMRKEDDFNVTDRISISYYGSEKLEKAVTAYSGYICRETLSDVINFSPDGLDGGREWKLNEEETMIKVELREGE